MFINKGVKLFGFSLVLSLMSAVSYADSQTYTLLPNQPLVLNNTLTTPLAAACVINANSSSINTLSIQMLHGSGMFDGTSLSQGQTIFHNVRNAQYLLLSASVGASAKIMNVGSYAVQAQCNLT